MPARMRTEPACAPEVALVVETLGGGGAERVAILLAGAFAAEGVATDLVVCRAEGPLRQAVPPGCRLVDLGVGRLRSAPLAIARYLISARPLALLPIMTEMNIAAALARLTLRTRPRMVWTVHNHLPARLGRERPLRASLMRACLRGLAPGAAAIVGVSEGVAEDLRRLLPRAAGRCRAIPNPVPEPEAFPPRRPRRPAAVPCLVAVGRLTRQKNHALLIDAVAELRTRRPLRLEILGDGPLRLDLETRIARLGLEDTVALRGHVRDVPERLAAADLFVLSSDYEGLPLALLEAMAAGCPVVATDCPHGPAEVLENGRWGRLVPVGQTDALAAAILSALERPGPDPRPRARAFALERTAAAYLSLLRGPEL